MDSEPILTGLKAVTKKWSKQRKAEERSAQARARRQSMWTYSRMSLKDIAYGVMTDAWNQASDNGRLPTHWRQIFYVARPLVAEHPEADRPLTASRFKAILEEYIADYQPGWDVLFGARGVFKEPHDPNGTRAIEMSTMGVRKYLHAGGVDHRIKHVPRHFPTHGAPNRFGAVLICEKEGFDELLQAERIPERYDLALMSTKGISARAARDLGRDLGVPCFTLHDLDKNGFVMAAGFPFATDIGIRLEDVEEWDLAPEEQWHKNRAATYHNLRKNGATREEAEFVSQGQRVELNMLTAPQLIEFVEQKLKEQGVEKVVPDAATLAVAWWRAQLAIQVNDLIDKLQEKGEEVPPMPGDLEERLRKKLEDEDELSWDDALVEIVEEG